MTAGLAIMIFQGCSKDEVLPQLPSIITATVSDISEVSATAGGKIEDSGSSAIIETGICWSINPNPTVEDNKITAAQNGESFSVSITGLKSGITYFVRAYATTPNGTGYGDQRSFTTEGQLALTLPFMERFKGAAFPPQYWQMIDHDGDGYQWYAYNNRFIGAMSDSYSDDGDDLSPYNFLISPKITISGANPKLEWNIGSAHLTYVEEHYKVVVSTAKFTEENCTSTGDVVFEETLDTDAGRTLVNRSVDMSAYAGKDVYIAWVHYDCVGVYALLLADIRIGSAENPAPVTTPVIGDLSVGDAFPGSTGVSSIITNDGGVNVVERGFCYSKSPNPTIENEVVDVAAVVSNVFSSFSADLDLEPATTYYVRAFAKNAVGVTYSAEQTVVVPNVSSIVLLDESFATDPFSRGWTSIDKDGDGYSWNYYADVPSIISNSYISGIGPVLPENYLISPAVKIPAYAQNVTLDFQVAAGANVTDYKEHYKVIISEDAITSDNCRSADVLQNWTELTAANLAKSFTDVSIDMTAYKGKTVYIGIVHGDCTDQYYIMVRKLSVYTH